MGKVASRQSASSTEYRPSVIPIPIRVVPERGEFLRHERGGLVHLIAELGLSVQTAPPLGSLVLKITGSPDAVHLSSQLQVYDRLEPLMISNINRPAGSVKHSLCILII
ncbi:hypothetical protein ACFHWW_33395 [Ensifer sp. P24N7]|uniref:hypothetical protein n=1 Tax=Sinorhizobium sp. P24N7 TaxID=3348358 RepID=UPI0035F3EC49